MIVVGVGCGPGMMTMDAVDRLRSARSVYGSERALELARPFLSPDCQVCRLHDYTHLEELAGDAVVLSTGDPMLAGLGHMGQEVVPGISSMQCAFSRLRLPLTRAVVVDAHGKDQTTARREMLDEVSRGHIPFVLTGPDFDLEALAALMRSEQVERTIVVLENLGYPDEVISFGSPRRPPAATSRLFSLILAPEP